MSKNRNIEKILKAAQGVFGKTYNAFKPLLLKPWARMLYFWNHPLVVILVSGIVLIKALPLLDPIIQQTFTQYLNCVHLIGNTLCKGFDFNINLGIDFSILKVGIDVPIFTVPGLEGTINPPLELVRKNIAWGIVIFFVFLSMYLTYVVNNLKTIVKFLAFDQAQWKSLLASLRTWLLIFVSLCLLFYYFVTQ